MRTKEVANILLAEPPYCQAIGKVKSIIAITLSNSLTGANALDTLRAHSPLSLNIFCRLCGGNGFGAHGQKRTEKQNESAPKLGVGEALVEYPRGKRERAGGAKQL